MGLRLATINDIEAMHRVRLAVLENRLRDLSRVQLDDYRHMLDSDGRGWVYELHEEIVGFPVADHVKRSIWALFVTPEHEGCGIGRALHDAMVEWLFRVAPGDVWLTTEPGTRAEHFYSAAGWQRIRLEDNGELRFELRSKPSSNALERTRSG